MKCEIRNFKPAENLSEETLAFTGTLYLDGKKACELSNWGHGDPIMFRWLNAELERDFQGYIKTLPPWEGFSGEMIPMDDEVFIGDLCEKTLQDRKIKRLTKKSILFRLRSNTYPGIARAMAKQWGSLP